LAFLSLDSCRLICGNIFFVTWVPLSTFSANSSHAICTAIHFWEAAPRFPFWPFLTGELSFPFSTSRDFDIPSPLAVSFSLFPPQAAGVISPGRSLSASYNEDIRPFRLGNPGGCRIVGLWFSPCWVPISAGLFSAF